jgi:hypothetical protein
VLPCGASGAHTSLFLTGLIQRPYPQWLISQLLDHEPPYHALSLTVVSDRVI